ncbi:hypothetical protein [Streptomyces noursei]|uniref:hypothetical protein n=1 Tax=Streptomyces noursei TaxID=1971 RepID=UPI0035DC9DE0
MARASHIHRPTENAAIGNAGQPKLPPTAVIADRLIAARATGDRYGVRLFGAMLDRAMGLGSVTA